MVCNLISVNIYKRHSSDDGCLFWLICNFIMVKNTFCRIYNLLYQIAATWLAIVFAPYLNGLIIPQHRPFSIEVMIIMQFAELLILEFFLYYLNTRFIRIELKNNNYKKLALRTTVIGFGIWISVIIILIVISNLLNS